MSVYFIANLKVKNEEGYQQYRKALAASFPIFPGKFLKVDNNPEVIEGKWNYNRLVIIEFSNKETFRQWYDSPEYQAIIALRIDNAECDIIVSGE